MPAARRFIFQAGEDTAGAEGEVAEGTRALEEEEGVMGGEGGKRGARKE